MDTLRYSYREQLIHLSFDQNWPNTGGKGVAHIQGHTYNNVLGWLRPKQNDIIEDTVATKPTVDLGGLQTKLEKYDVIETSALGSMLLAKDQELFDLRKKINTPVKQNEEPVLGPFARVGSKLDKWVVELAQYVTKRT